jgi:hypothetical protein
MAKLSVQEIKNRAREIIAANPGRIVNKFADRLRLRDAEGFQKLFG